MIVLLFHPQKFDLLDFLGLYSFLFIQGLCYGCLMISRSHCTSKMCDLTTDVEFRIPCLLWHL